MTVELQSTRLQFGRVAAERTRLQSQLENNERLLDAASSPDRERSAAFLPELGVHLDRFDAAFDGAACGFSLMYQPVVELQSGAITGFEALLRLRHPKRGDILPLEFIGRLEASGEILSVGHWVLRQACADLVKLQRDHKKPLRMAVNVSPREFERAGFAEDVVRVISAANLPTPAVELELTEGVAMSMHAPVIRQLQHLRDAGVRLAMDDFGTGFSNFASMSEAPLSRIKIDRSMISSIGRGERQAAVLRSMVQTARNLGLPLIAEGIEGAHQLAELRALGCEEGQGFMFGAAVPLEAARIRLQRE
jgi:EAL domain-containing protein (putative c-di-GMP-specific phosphodiesterase class I)